MTLVPHTHWDREWYEPFEVFCERLGSMMDGLLDLLEAGFPHFHSDGQVAMIDDYLARRPEREPQVRRVVAEGRLSLGPWVTQMDAFLVSGESHVRNLERGLLRARELGPALEIGYLPDQFGHVGQIPQILRLHGIGRAVVWRGVSRAIDRTAFRWRAPDGSEVLAEYLMFGYANGANLERAADPARLAEEIAESVERLRPYLAGDRALVMVGYDHAGPDPTLPERLERARPAMPDLDVRVGGLAEHVEEQGLASELPVWEGELRSAARAHLLPNVVSARAPQKRERGRVETLIERVAEPLAAQVPGFTWPSEELDRAWTLLLWNGAHDSVCGCSHDKVAWDVDARLAEARTIGERVVGRAMVQLASRMRSAGSLRFNPSPFRREGVPGNGWAVAPPAPAAGPAPVVVEPLPDGGGVVADGVPIRLLDEPDVGDLYNFCPAAEDQVAMPPAGIRIRGSHLEATWDGLRVLARFSHAGEGDLVRVDGVVDNRRPDHRLRLHIGLSRATEEVLAGSPFELVERPLVGEGSRLEAASPTWPARHVLLAGGRAVLHEGVFEYEVPDGREMAVTLLRCVGTISRDSLATRPFPAGPDVPTPEAQMLGETAFAVGIWAQASRGGLWDRWERFALPIVEVHADGGGDLPDEGVLLRLEGEAVLSSIRRADDGLQVRLWNPWKDRPAIVRVDEVTEELEPARIATIRPAHARLG